MLITFVSVSSSYVSHCMKELGRLDLVRYILYRHNINSVLSSGKVVASRFLKDRYTSSQSLKPTSLSLSLTSVITLLKCTFLLEYKFYQAKSA